MSTKLIYYVYSLVDSRTGLPFYVGKGRNGRLKFHVLEASKDPSKWTNPLKCNKIVSILRDGGTIEYSKVYYKSSEEALDAEKHLIARLGRVINGTGILTNITEGGEAGNPVTKWVYEYNSVGELIAEYESVQAAACAHNTHPSNITRIIHGRDLKQLRGSRFTLEKQANIGNYHSNRGDRVVLQMLPDGSIVAEHRNTREAATAVGLKHPSSIRSCCCGKISQVRGYVFCYK